ncbi:hypothetical protein AAIB33_08040 [Microbacterium sp. AZCO]|uniref:hypothetical protein n=1 Tax=Microbacterium sp. AZCO TaxID=3142976 RepID=UPI0031F3FCB0
MSTHSSRRTVDSHHLRDAVHIQPVEKVEATEWLFQKIADGTFDPRRRAPELPAAGAPREDDRPPRDPRDRDARDQPPEDPAVVIGRLRRSRLVPGALASTACDDHGAEVGQPCFRAAVGICGERLSRALVARIPEPVEDYGWDELHRRAERERVSARMRRANSKTPERVPRPRFLQEDRRYEGGR